jgi:glyoxylase-like metal-dependent hydrolase (beta-lactamase superfamily II)
MIADGVFDVPITYVHAFLVVDDDGVVLVDTGLPGRSKKLHEALDEARKKIGDVHTILLTHWHPDHVGGVADLRRASGARVVAHQLDAEVISGDKPVPPVNGFMKIGSWFMGKPEVAAVDHRLTTDGPTPLAGFSAYHTPGHTDGHVSYLLDRAGGVLFAGDAAAGGRSKVGYTPRMVTADVNAARASVARLAQLEFRVAVFGHGPAVTDAAVDRFRELAAR